MLEYTKITVCVPQKLAYLHNLRKINEIIIGINQLIKASLLTKNGYLCLWENCEACKTELKQPKVIIPVVSRSVVSFNVI